MVSTYTTMSYFDPELSDVHFDADLEAEMDTGFSEFQLACDEFAGRRYGSEQYDWASLRQTRESMNVADTGFATVSFDPQILIVDNDQDHCAHLIRVINALGYHVDVTRDGEEALDFVKLHDYRLAVLELMLPDMDGIELFDHLRKERSRHELQAMILTAHAEPEFCEIALMRGLQAVMTKPVDLVELIRLIQLHVGEPDPAGVSSPEASFDGLNSLRPL